VAQVNGLDVRRDFPAVLDAAADLAGAGLELVAPIAATRMAHAKPSYPPPGEVANLWEGCRTVTSDPEVSGWLRSRVLDPGTTEERDLARALPPNAAVPRWAFIQRHSWAEAGYRCILPLRDATGVLRSVRARRVGGGDGPKAVPPTGFRVRGLVMVDALGCLLLETGRPPDLWPEAHPLRVVVTEGEPDFLTWATRFTDADETSPAVVGISSGSWTDAIAARIPNGARVVIRTHHDDAGERYALAIQATLRGRPCVVVRGGARGCPHCAQYGWTRGAA
jgi:hypothetical protein